MARWQIRLMAVFALSGFFPLWASPCASGGATLVFGNGINTVPADAWASTVNLYNSIFPYIPSAKQTCLNPYLAYDINYLDPGDPNPNAKWVNTVLQVIDAAEQKGIEFTA